VWVGFVHTETQVLYVFPASGLLWNTQANAAGVHDPTFSASRVRNVEATSTTLDARQIKRPMLYLFKTVRHIRFC
jgi:hypothetical protein